MVLVALALVAVLAMLALVLDGGYGYLQRRRMQNAADAAAFAGTRQLATRLDDTGATELAVLSAVNRYAELNGVPDSNANVRAYFVDSGNSVLGGRMGTNGGVPSGSVAVAVKVQATYDTFIADVIGFPTLTASAIGQGRYGSVGSATGLVPLAVRQFDFVFDQPYSLWDNDPPGLFDISPGQRGYVYLDGLSNGGNKIKDWMANGYPGVVTVGSSLDGKPGTVDVVVQDAYDRIVQGNGRQFVIVPLYDNAPVPPFHISGFAAFELTEAVFRGTDKYIKGKFVKTLVSHADFGGTVDTGLTTIKLTLPATLP